MPGSDACRRRWRRRVSRALSASGKTHLWPELAFSGARSQPGGVTATPPNIHGRGARCPGGLVLRRGGNRVAFSRTRAARDRVRHGGGSVRISPGMERVSSVSKTTHGLLPNDGNRAALSAFRHRRPARAQLSRMRPWPSRRSGGPAVDLAGASLEGSRLLGSGRAQ